ncbi:hypothetical protein SUGI_0322660 [Cryptomeria japonica]|nr:hypothetical protein SUGI_0322660 [Cryptomeria japonica]
MMGGGLIELGCIACEELGEFGAGKEGWLHTNPNLNLALTSHYLALTNQSLVIVLNYDGEGSQIVIRPSMSAAVEGHITAMEWLVFDHDQTLALSTSQGFLIIYSSAGDLLHKQAGEVHDADQMSDGATQNNETPLIGYSPMSLNV